MNRREFLGAIGAASAFTIVPRRVLGGPGHIPPSDMILLAQVGCGTSTPPSISRRSGKARQRLPTSRWRCCPTNCGGRCRSAARAAPRRTCSRTAIRRIVTRSRLGVPEWVEGRPSNEAWVDDRRVSSGGRVSQAGLPKASTIRWPHPPTAARPAVDTFWYDGGMKPQTPEELFEDKEDLADEGMLFVGDKGKILCDFRGNKPRLIPRSRRTAFEGSVVAKDFDTTSAEDEWVNALKNWTIRSKGSFEAVAPLAEAVTIAIVALRVPYKRLLWDAAKLEFGNSAEATKLVRRQQMRDGWERIIG